MIAKASECSVRVFMRALFEEDYTDILDFGKIYDEYVDLSGAAETQELELMVLIHNIEVRMFVTNGFVQFQKDYIAQYNEPYWDGFWVVKKYNHELKWNNDKQEFLDQMEMMLSREKRFVPELANYQKELSQLQKEGSKPDSNGRKQFIKLLNAVGKDRRNDVDRDKTDVETFALMVKDYFDSRKN